MMFISSGTLLLQKLNTWSSITIYPLTLVFPFVLVFLYKSITMCGINKAKRRPPSPPKLPIVGNLHQIGLLPHQSFATLSCQFGKTMLLHFGSKPILIISSPEGVREILKTQDLSFCNRPKSRVTQKFFYGCKDVGFSPYGEHWRMMKSICIMQLLSNKRVQSIKHIRQEEVALVMKQISNSSLVVNLSEIIKTQTYDLICRATFGRKYGSNDKGSFNFKELLDETMELLGVFCVGDFIPWLSFVDRLRGLDARLEKIGNELDDLLDKVIQEHQFRLSKNKLDVKIQEMNFVENLLEHQWENKDTIPMEDIKAVILLIRHPRVMKELQDEVRNTVEAKGSILKIDEDDLDKLKYLKLVLKESLRLHPPAPLLVFRETLQDAQVNGFDIDARTHVFINAWAIHRDPAYWEQPLEFCPERFMDNNNTFNFKGQDNFQYTPFGGGRRICPGTSFAMVNAELMLANLIYEFDWKLPLEFDGKLDMTESIGITVHKQHPLMLIATPNYCRQS
ncbi:Cytochrome P450 71A25 [Bienertia sinuspersici]